MDGPLNIPFGDYLNVLYEVDPNSSFLRIVTVLADVLRQKHYTVA